jgi:glycosyltransferase involved in cell wall biosynthesis
LPSALLHGPYAILQGAGINVDRGGEELVLAMQYVDELKLLVVGDGDALPAMKQMVAAKGLEQKVVFLPRMPKAKLMGYTRRAVLGLAIDKVTNLNYRYALPNKLFDFIQAGVPVIHADGEEIAAVVNQFGIGLPIESHQPEHIAKAISDAWSDQTRYAQWKENLKKAAESLTWSREKIILEKAIRDAF